MRPVSYTQPIQITMSTRRHLTLFILFLTLFACQKDDDSSPVAVAACRIQKEMNMPAHEIYDPSLLAYNKVSRL
jgi:hypothetical protein